MSYDQELAFAKELAQEAGKIMKRYFRADDQNLQWKSDNTPLTVADTTINAMVVERVKESYPGYAVIGEEESNKGDGAYAWVVDPIDGTLPFTVGIPVSTFSLALVDLSDGQPLVAVTYDPYLDKLHWATKSGGAFLNGKKLATSNATEFSQRVVAVVGGGMPDQKVRYTPTTVFDKVREQDGRYFSFVSHVYATNFVASGELVASSISYGSPWDSAAVCLLVREAGGVVSDIEGKSRRFDEMGNGCVLSANETIHAKMLEAIKPGLQ